MLNPCTFWFYLSYPWFLFLDLLFKLNCHLKPIWSVIWTLSLYAYTSCEYFLITRFFIYFFPPKALFIRLRNLSLNLKAYNLLIRIKVVCLRAQTCPSKYYYWFNLYLSPVILWWGFLFVFLIFHFHQKFYRFLRTLKQNFFVFQTV